MNRVLKGGCLCGAVRFAATGPFAPVCVCHCSQCARWTGHVFASTTVAREHLKIEDDTQVAWYHSSPEARRGFCRTCGSNLFWERMGADEIDIMAGALEPPTGLKTVRHIFVADKSDYYEICDDVPRFPQYGRVDG